MSTIINIILVNEITMRCVSKSISLLASIFATAIILMCAGCGPTVQLAERAYLAEPGMALEPHPAESTFHQHCFDSKEAASGGFGISGGGCGCH